MEDFEMSPDGLEEAKEKLFKKLDEALEFMEKIASEDSKESKQRITELMHESIIDMVKIYSGIGTDYKEAYKFARRLNTYAKKIYEFCSNHPDSYIYMMGYFNGNYTIMGVEEKEE